MDSRVHRGRAEELTAYFGLILARDAATFYVLFALMSFASYGLVVHDRSELARRAGRVYIVLVVAGEVALFAGLMGLVADTGLNVRLPVGGDVAGGSLALVLLAVGFGIKAGMLFLHVGLPLAHPAAPVPASAVLSGAMIKAGIGRVPPGDLITPVEEASRPLRKARFRPASLSAVTKALDFSGLAARMKQRALRSEVTLGDWERAVLVLLGLALLLFVLSIAAAQGSC